MAGSTKSQQMKSNKWQGEFHPLPSSESFYFFKTFLKERKQVTIFLAFHISKYTRYKHFLKRVNERQSFGDEG